MPSTSCTSSPGSLDVVNQIRVASAGPGLRNKGEDSESVERSAEVEASRTTVQTEGGRVVLSGKVRAWYERDIAEGRVVGPGCSPRFRIT